MTNELHISLPLRYLLLTRRHFSIERTCEGSILAIAPRQPRETLKLLPSCSFAAGFSPCFWEGLLRKPGLQPGSPEGSFSPVPHTSLQLPLDPPQARALSPVPFAAFSLQDLSLLPISSAEASGLLERRCLSSPHTREGFSRWREHPANTLAPQ